MDLRRRYLSWRFGDELYGFLVKIAGEDAAAHAYRMAMAAAPLGRASLYAEAYNALSGRNNRRSRPEGPLGALSLYERALVVLRLSRGMSWRACATVLGARVAELPDDFVRARETLMRGRRADDTLAWAR